VLNADHPDGRLPDLAVPIDDGACQHLLGLQLPSISLMSTTGGAVDLAQLPGITVVYCYPRAGIPGEIPPEGWESIPGARGCTAESCAFRDHYQELLSRGATQVYGLSTQTTAAQQEAVSRLHLPFTLLSDAELVFTCAAHLPTFAVAGMTCIKRLTLIVANGRCRHVFYPVFPPEEHAAEVLSWLALHFQRGRD
jgi:peroxiredoxin